MRMRFFFVSIAVIALAALAGSAFAAPGGDPGKPEDPGKSAEAPGHNKADADAKHDPSNPDGTYHGKSPSSPDQDGIGADHGVDNNDKTGPGTDGNNGCGNDPDREDDNNGWCGRKPAPQESPTAEPEPTETPDDERTPEVSPTTTVSPSPQAQVLGRKLVRTEVAGAELAQTGMGLATPVAAASALFLVGIALRAIGGRPRF